MSFFLLQIIIIIDNIKSNARITAKTIIAAKDDKISEAIAAAPTNNPTTKAKAIANIIVTIPKHLLLLHFSFFSLQ